MERKGTLLFLGGGGGGGLGGGFGVERVSTFIPLPPPPPHLRSCFLTFSAPYPPNREPNGLSLCPYKILDMKISI